jgi:hypothetical protein
MSQLAGDPCYARHAKDCQLAYDIDIKLQFDSGYSHENIEPAIKTTFIQNLMLWSMHYQHFGPYVSCKTWKTNQRQYSE